MTFTAGVGHCACALDATAHATSAADTASAEDLDLEDLDPSARPLMAPTGRMKALARLAMELESSALSYTDVQRLRERRQAIVALDRMVAARETPELMRQIIDELADVKRATEGLGDGHAVGGQAASQGGEGLH